MRSPGFGGRVVAASAAREVWRKWRRCTVWG
jgi:hypothetical protein